MSISTADQRVVALNKTNALRFVAAGVPNGNQKYLLGRNREWDSLYGGGVYAARWQLDAVDAFRTHLAAGSLGEARLAWLAIIAGCNTVQADGFIPFRVPAELNYMPTAADIAQAAAFFLSGCGTAALALAQYSSTEIAAVSSQPERDALLRAIKAGIAWLDRQRDVLLEADKASPNRLLFDALAFHACGKVIGAIYDQKIFVDAVLALFADGVFVENGGGDTHYQAVAINQGVDLFLAGYSHTHLQDALVAAAEWYYPRIDANGVIHSKGNTRTCFAGESLLGVPKKMSPIDVWRALSYVGVAANDERMLEAAGRVADWINTNPTETCVL